MDPAVLCSLALLIALLVVCGGCVREEDRGTGSSGGLFPEPVPTVPTIPEPWEPPTVPTLPGNRHGWSPGYQNAQCVTLSEPMREG